MSADSLPAGGAYAEPGAGEQIEPRVAEGPLCLAATAPSQQALSLERKRTWSHVDDAAQGDEDGHRDPGGDSDGDSDGDGDDDDDDEGNSGDGRHAPEDVEGQPRPEIAPKPGKNGHNGIREFRCPEPTCGRSYFRKTHLSRHMLSHSGEKPFRCSVPGCEWAYANNYHLKRHMESHQKDMPYMCQHEGCSQGFRKHAQLRRHEFEHTNRLPFACPFENCSSGFMTQGDLTRHVRKHKTYACLDCGSSFEKWSELVAHRKAEHPAVRVCPHCSKAYHNRSTFRDHVKTHDTMRELHPCTVEGCTRTYNSIHARNVHINSYHLKQKPFACGVDGCGLAFAHKHTLVKHLQNVHGVSSPSTPVSSAPPTPAPVANLASLPWRVEREAEEAGEGRPIQARGAQAHKRRRIDSSDEDEDEDEDGEEEEEEEDEHEDDNDEDDS